MLYSITLPFPPSVNALFGGGSAQRRFPTKQYKEWLLRCPQVTNRPRINTPVSVYYDFYMPDNRLRDLGNYEKAVTDWLVKSEILEDDNHNIIKKVTLNFCSVQKGHARVEIMIDNF